MSDKINMSLDDIIKSRKESQKKTPKKFDKSHVKKNQKKFKNEKPLSKNDRRPRKQDTIEAKSEPSKSKLFVKGLNIATTNNQLRDLFSEHGKLVSCGINWDQLGRSKGTGQVEFNTAEEAEAAIEKLNNTEFAGHTITVVLFKS